MLILRVKSFNVIFLFAKLSYDFPEQVGKQCRWGFSNFCNSCCHSMSGQRINPNQICLKSIFKRYAWWVKKYTKSGSKNPKHIQTVKSPPPEKCTHWICGGPKTPPVQCTVHPPPPQQLKKSWAIIFDFPFSFRRSFASFCIRTFWNTALES